ncbi:hypothetical protein SAY86_020503 [Trapa natans]|uniref:Uncharacterized protein n=1 Tax=Trapa natans TaxID=22666 RepID=A0AAN7R1U6_TRANT|nr:hypothetical protein SAY86_020503 [Trapa natans]
MPILGITSFASVGRIHDRSITGCLASGESGYDAVSVAQLSSESPVGQFLARILQIHGHLLLSAADQQLENLQTERDLEKEKTSSSEDLLYKRTGEVKEKESCNTLKEIIYCIILQKFLDCNISMIPKITTSDPAGRVDLAQPGIKTGGCAFS